MINPFKDVNWSPDLAAKRRFALSFVVGFPCLALLLLLLRRVLTGAWHVETSLWIGGVGAGLGLLLFTVPLLAKPFYLAWYFVACCVGIIVSNLLLALFFFLAVIPMGLIMRLLGKTPLQKRMNRAAATYWRDAQPIADPERYYKQF